MITALIAYEPLRCGFCPATAVALVRWDVGEYSYRTQRYCVDHLDKMFDAVDAIGIKTHGHLNREPTHVTWIQHARSHWSHWCLRHGWPRPLCRTWWHGPGTGHFGQDQITLWEARQRRATVSGPSAVRDGR